METFETIVGWFMVVFVIVAFFGLMYEWLKGD